MTREEREFWERAATAAMTGLLSQGDPTYEYESDKIGAAAAECADALLGQYRARVEKPAR